MSANAFRVVELSAADGRSAISAAITLCRAFSNDPLVKWLRPGMIPWATPEPETMEWQKRRVQKTCIKNRVFTICDVVPEKLRDPDEFVGHPAVGMICPPKTNWSRRLSDLGSWFRLLLADLIRPVDAGGSPARLGTMISRHATGETLLRRTYNKPLWYIEVVAVDPKYQGLKLGSMILQHMVALCPAGEPVYLECTDKNNVGFYEKYGFKVFEEAELVDDTAAVPEKVKLFVMVKF